MIPVSFHEIKRRYHTDGILWQLFAVIILNHPSFHTIHARFGSGHPRVTKRNTIFPEVGVKNPLAGASGFALVDISCSEQGSKPGP